MILRRIRTFIFGTLRGRLILSVAIVHAVMMTLFIIDLTIRQREMLLNRQEEAAIVLSQSLSTSAAEWLAAKDVSGLQEVVEVQRRFPEMVYIIITDELGKILAHTDKSKTGQYMADAPVVIKQTFLNKNSELIDVATPAFIGGSHVGWIRVGLGMQIANQKLINITLDGILYAFGAIILGSLIAWMMGHRITKRLYAVQDTIKKIKTGNLKTRSSIKGTDEAAVVAGEFNAMLDVLDEQKSILAESETKYRTLIQKIQAAVVVHGRTTEIITSNSLAQELLGLSEEQMLGKTGFDPVWHFFREDGSIMPPEEYPVNKVFATHQALRNFVVGLHPSGNSDYVWVLVNADPLMDDKNEIMQIIVTFIDITKRKEVEADLNRAAEEIRDLYNHAPCGYHSIDKDGTFVRMNDTELEWLGLKREDVIGKIKFIDIVTSEGLHTFEESFDKFKASGIMKDLEYEFVRKDGSILPVLLSATAINDIKGNFLMSRATVYDITDRKQIELARFEKQKVFRTLVENSPDIIARYDKDCKRIYVNPAYLKTAMISQQELLDTSPVQLSPLPTASAEILQALIKKVLSNGIADSVDVSWPKADNIEYWYNIYASPEFDREGRIESVLTISRDVTTRKYAEESLKRLNRELMAVSNCNQALLRARNEITLLNNICNIICSIAGYLAVWVGYAENDIKKTIRSVASAGIKKEYLLDLNLSWSEDFEGGNIPEGAVIRSGNIIYSENFESDSGGFKWDEHLKSCGCRSGIVLPLKEENTKILGILVIYSSEINIITKDEKRLLEELTGDLTFGISTLRMNIERREAEFALRSSEEKIRTIFNIMEEALCLNELIMDEKGEIIDYKILEVNPAYERETGFAHEKVVGKKATEIYGVSTESINSFWKKHIHDICEIKTDSYDENTKRWRHVSTSIPFDNKFVMSFFDITEQKEAEKEIIFAKEKAEEMNRIKSNFLANMSHELRTPFVGIMGYAEYLKEMQTDPQLLLQNSSDIADGILATSNRLVDTLTKILNFTKIEFEEINFEKKPELINEIIDLVIKRFKPEAVSRGLYLRSNSDNLVIVFDTDKSILTDILSNLVDNAIKYTVAGGIEIIAGLEGTGEEPDLKILVKDTGIGIPEDKQDLIWEEFRQVSEGTSREYQGTGLGLAITKKYLEKLGGSIELISSPGLGSAFTILLPSGNKSDF